MTKSRPSARTSRRKTRRRAVEPEQRQIDAQRSRRALLDAALEEFAAHGFAGATVRAIANRAAVSKDLINYHFGGKHGLYREVQRAWLEHKNAFHDPDASLVELAARYLHDALTDPRPMRLLAWRGLTEDEEQPPDISPETEDLTSIRRRQQRGELHPDLDPAALRLVLLGAIAAPVLMPHAARKLFALDPTDPKFETRYSDGLRAILKHLEAGPQAGPSDTETSRRLS